jgi:hypothetical protein
LPTRGAGNPCGVPAATDAHRWVRCGLCGVRIGAYEPLLILLDGGALVRTSLVVSPDPASRGLVFHAACDGASDSG